MFKLEQAVDEWCRKVTNTDEFKDELSDHLYCQIEALLTEGLTEQQAFNIASKKLGNPEDLLDDYSRNRKLFAKLCQTSEPTLNDYTQQRSSVMTYKANVKRILSQSILWATAIVCSGLLLGDAEQQFSYVMLLSVLAIVSIGIDPGYREAARVEAQFFRKAIRSIRRS